MPRNRFFFKLRNLCSDFSLNFNQPSVKFALINLCKIYMYILIQKYEYKNGVFYFSLAHKTSKLKNIRLRFIVL